MSKKTTFFLAVFSFIFLVSQFLFVSRSYVQSRLLNALQAPKVFLVGLYNRGTNLESQEKLLLENQSLRARVLELQMDPARTLENNKTYIVSRVFSEYPFNNADKILINAGEKHGVTKGSSVFASPGIYLGVVTEVASRYATVRTVFDPGWEVPVYIGEEAESALLIGGYQPELTLINKDGQIASGDNVYLSGKDFPYGATVGFVDDIESESNERFERAHVSVPYTRNNLQEVYILPL